MTLCWTYPIICLWSTIQRWLQHVSGRQIAFIVCGVPTILASRSGVECTSLHIPWAASWLAISSVISLLMWIQLGPTPRHRRKTYRLTISCSTLPISSSAEAPQASSYYSRSQLFSLATTGRSPGDRTLTAQAWPETRIRMVALHWITSTTW